jgi:hypothetical protein
MRSSGLAALPIIALLLLVGCNHVPLEEGASDVQIIDASKAESCERLGKTKVEVLAKVVGVGRSQEKMGEELSNLARNAAADMGGNAVMAEGEIEDGKQTFGVYKCPAR